MSSGNGAITAEQIHKSEREVAKFRVDSLNNDERRVKLCICPVPRLGKKYFGVQECLNCSKPTKDLPEFQAVGLRS